MFHLYTEDQKEVLRSAKAGEYRKMNPQKSDSGTNYMTFSGIEFSWLHGLGRGEDVTILRVRQPQWFAKRIIKALLG